MEEAVRASERLRSLMYDAVTDVVFYVGVEPDGGFRFLSVNPAFLKVTGLGEHEVVGQPVRDVIPEPALTMVMANNRRAIAERRTVRWDEASTYPAGTRYGEVSVAPLFDTAGVCTNLVGTVHDVTERRTTQERLLAQAALLDQAKDAIMVRDLDGVIHYWNKGAERLYGWSSAEALDSNVRDLLYDDADDGRQFERAHAHVRQTGQWSGELAHVTRAGASGRRRGQLDPAGRRARAPVDPVHQQRHHRAQTARDADDPLAAAGEPRHAGPGDRPRLQQHPGGDRRQRGVRPARAAGRSSRPVLPGPGGEGGRPGPGSRWPGS